MVYEIKIFFRFGLVAQHMTSLIGRPGSKKDVPYLNPDSYISQTSLLFKQEKGHPVEYNRNFEQRRIAFRWGIYLKVMVGARQ